MKLTKQDFNNQVAQDQIDIRPTNTAIIEGKTYKILPVKSTDTHVELEYIEDVKPKADEE